MRQVRLMNNTMTFTRVFFTFLVLSLLFFGGKLSPLMVLLVFLGAVVTILIVSAYLLTRIRNPAEEENDFELMELGLGNQMLNDPVIRILQLQRNPFLMEMVNWRALHLMMMQRDFRPEDYEALRDLDNGGEQAPAPPGVIDSIPSFVIPPSSGDVETGAGDSLLNDDCPICLETFQPGDRVSRLPCRHVYHTTCINQWLRVQGRCPVCKARLPSSASSSSSSSSS
eukprot:TRINITY_DN1003_c0_g1_i3.p1 TRINITY_DN1003_c0_g1~~TRINITY_DN1003_c0_g1_i3.p1  ORF type:complete len:226 (+),score=46.46 TRINITY_DN1003_c0_g1_i3:205-882(+)